MKPFFSHQRCSDLKHAAEYVDCLQQESKHWIFRGQRDSCWSLKTNLERECARFNVPPCEIEEVERRLLREFKRRVHHYSANVPHECDTEEWLALMQHHGAPTRLLDWTYSFYVAAYFAFECAKNGESVTIWALNTEWCNEAATSILGHDGRGLSDILNGAVDERPRGWFDKVFGADPPILFVHTVNPFRLNERLTYQRGVFVAPGKVSAPFANNLRNLEGYDSRQNIVKLVILTGRYGCGRDKALKQLQDMNITRATLFPDLDGFAQSLGTGVRFFRDQARADRVLLQRRRSEAP